MSHVPGRGRNRFGVSWPSAIRDNLGTGEEPSKPTWRDYLARLTAAFAPSPPPVWIHRRWRRRKPSKVWESVGASRAVITTDMLTRAHKFLDRLHKDERLKVACRRHAMSWRARCRQRNAIAS